MYPPKKLTISQRVAKWFSGFKIPSTKVICEPELLTKIANFIITELTKILALLIVFFKQRRRFGGSRFPGERVTLGGGYGHGQYPLDYDYYDSGDDHNLIFYGQHNGIYLKFDNVSSCNFL